jgi:glucokinase
MKKPEQRHIAIGADIGGGHITCAALDLNTKKILKDSYSTEKVNGQAESEIIIASWVKALNNTISMIDSNALAGIGFAMPGPFDYENGIALFKQVVKFDHLYGVNVADEIRKIISVDKDISLRFMNDATCFGVGEAWIGQAKDFKNMVAITLGTGFGSAFYEDGIPVVDRDDVPEMGCVYHLPYKGSIADDTFSTRWYIKRYAQKTGKKVTGVKEIFNSVHMDPSARECFVEFGNNLAEFSAPWLKTFNADVMVIGGNVTGAYKIWGKAFEKSLKERDVQIMILLSDLMEDAAIVGSARLVEGSYWQRVKGLLPKM